MVIVASLLEFAKGSIQTPAVFSSKIKFFIGKIEKVFLLGIAQILSITGCNWGLLVGVSSLLAFFFLASTGFEASDGIAQLQPNFFAPVILDSLHSFVSLRSLMPHKIEASLIVK